MKIRFTLVLLLFACSSLFSQTWAPDGAVWHYSLNYFGSWDQSYNTMTVQGDSVINGITCSRIIRLHTTCNMQPAKEFMYQDSNRVFYWDPPSNDFLLLYDFNLQVGQTYDILSKRLNMLPPYDTIHLRVDSTYSISLNGQARQVQVIGEFNPSIPATVNQYEVIEGIGSNWQMFPWDNGLCDYQYDTELRCYEDSALGLQNFWAGSICDAIILSLDEPTPSSHRLEVFPNPARNLLKWDLQNSGIHPFAVRVFDNQGSLVKQVTTYEDHVELTGLPNGVYFIEIRDDTPSTYREKFLILN